MLIYIWVTIPTWELIVQLSVRKGFISKVNKFILKLHWGTPKPFLAIKTIVQCFMSFFRKWKTVVTIFHLAFHPCSNIIKLLKLLRCIFQIEVGYKSKVKNRIFHQMRGLFQETEEAMNIQVVWKFILRFQLSTIKS